MRPAYDVRVRRWREGGRFVNARRGRRRSDRLGRALELAALGNVIPIGNGPPSGRQGEWRVWSADGLHLYTVSLDGCDCPDSLYRKTTCKHRLAVGPATRRPAAEL